MNAEVITENDPMLKAVEGLSPSVVDYKNAIEDVFTNAANQNPIDEYFVIFVGKRKDKVDVGAAVSNTISGGAGGGNNDKTVQGTVSVIGSGSNNNDNDPSSGDSSNSTTDNAEIYEAFCTYKSSQLTQGIDHTTIIVKKDDENPIVLYNRDNKMLKAESNNIFHLIDTIVSPVLGQQIGDNMNVAEKIFFKGLPATPPGGNPPVPVTGTGGEEGGEGGRDGGTNPQQQAANQTGTGDGVNGGVAGNVAGNGGVAGNVAGNGGDGAAPIARTPSNSAAANQIAGTPSNSAAANPIAPANPEAPGAVAGNGAVPVAETVPAPAPASSSSSSSSSSSAAAAPAGGGGEQGVQEQEQVGEQVGKSAWWNLWGGEGGRGEEPSDMENPHK
jgi:hypothetical protein